MLCSRKFKIKKLLLKLLLCMLLLTPISCATTSGKKLSAPVTLPDKFSKTGQEPLHKKWWLAFADSELSRLIDSALSDNLNLQVAWDRLEQSRAVARKSGAETLPRVDGNISAAKTVVDNSGSSAVYGEQFSAGVVASYELDLWGRVGATSNAAKLDMLASRENLYAAAISLSVEVATVWYKLIEQRGQIELLDRQIKNHKDYLEVVTARFAQGMVPSADVLQQRQALEATKESKIKIKSNIKLFEHQLAVLLGKVPGTLTIPESVTLPKLPPLPENGLPAELVNNRPDIQSAFLMVQAADKRVAASIANRYPRLSLSASIETSSTKVSDLFKDWFATLLGNLLIPIFDNDSRSAEVDRTKAALSERINKYGQTILLALREVEDAISRESFQVKRLDSLDKQIGMSKKVVELTRNRYKHGATDFLRLLNALLSYHSLQRNQLMARRELIEYRIGLYRALAGSPEMSRSVVTRETGESNGR